jgi:hypothetical protein
MTALELWRIGANYAFRLAARGIAALVVDPSIRGFQADGLAVALDVVAGAPLEETRTGVLTRENWLPETMVEADTAGVTDIDPNGL